MTFPVTPLGVRIDLQIGGAWTDVTADVLVRDGITITRGRANEASRAGPQTCALTLKDPTGKYSSRNPVSPYYGAIGRNTPLRVGVGRPSIGATQTSAVASVNLVAPSVAAEVSGFLLCVWGAGAVGNVTGPGGFTMGTERDGAVSTWAAGLVAIAAGSTGTQTATHSVSAPAQACASIAVPAPGGVIGGGFSAVSTSGALATVTYAAAAGDYLIVVNGFSSDPGNQMVRAPAERQAQTPNWVLLSDSGASAGPRMKVWARRVETTTASSDLYFTGDGISTADNYARAWVVTGASDYFARFSGEVPSWPPSWDLSGTDVRVPIVATGPKRRMGQGASPLRSALRRELGKTSGVVAYWPMEDGSDSTAFGSGLPGGAAMGFLGAPVPAADTQFLCAEALATFSGAGAAGSVSYSPTTSWAVGTLVNLPAGLVDEATLLTIGASGSIVTWTVKYDATGSGFRVEAYNSAGGSVWNTSYAGWAFDPIGTTVFMYFTAVQSGADVVWRLVRVGFRDGDDTPTTQNVSGTVVGQTSGAVTKVQVGAGAVALDQPVVFGHVVVGNASTALFQAGVLSALTGWAGETPQSRFVRLGAEEDFDVAYQAFVSQDDMGVQRPETLLSLIEQCEDTDGGSIVEPRGFVGLVFRPRAGRYNQAPALTLSYSTSGHIAEPLEPVDDDQATRNDVTVTRVGGGSSRAEATTGRLSTASPPAGVGRYDVNVPLSLQMDANTRDQASWRLHLGTWDEARWPIVRTRLEAAPSLIPATQALDVGDLVTLTGLPSWVPPGDADLILEGYTETLLPFSWEWVGNFSPAGPYRVGVADSTTYGRADSELSTLAAGVTSTATALSVAVASGSALWITTATFPAQFPFDAIVGGEVVTVTGITGTSSPQSWSVTRSTNGVVKAQVSGAQIRLARPVVVAL